MVDVDQQKVLQDQQLNEKRKSQTFCSLKDKKSCGTKVSILNAHLTSSFHFKEKVSSFEMGKKYFCLVLNKDQRSADAQLQKNVKINKNVWRWNTI
jgi:hypothetical protein